MAANKKETIMAKKDNMLARINQSTNDGLPLALQHLDYVLTIDHGRAALTEHAMRNTQLLMGYAVEIMQENPESAGALKEIMRAYVEATGEDIMGYGRPKRR